MDMRKEVPEAKQCSDYERLRFMNIGRNQAFLESLGVPNLGLEPLKRKATSFRQEKENSAGCTTNTTAQEECQTRSTSTGVTCSSRHSSIIETSATAMQILLDFVLYSPSP